MYLFEEVHGWYRNGLCSFIKRINHSSVYKMAKVFLFPSREVRLTTLDLRYLKKDEIREVLQKSGHYLNEDTKEVCVIGSEMKYGAYESQRIIVEHLFREHTENPIRMPWKDIESLNKILENMGILHAFKYEELKRWNE